MAKILIAHVDGKMMYYMQGFGFRLSHKNYDVVEIPIVPAPSENFQTIKESNFKRLTDFLNDTSTENHFDLVIVFDEYDQILDQIKSLIPTKVPVFYVDIYNETEQVDGFTWFGSFVLPSEILEEANKLLNIDSTPV